MSRQKAIKKSDNFGKTLRRIIKLLFKKYTVSTILVVVFALVSTIFGIVGPKIMGRATTELFEGLVAKINNTGSINFEKIAGILLTVLGLYLLSALFIFSCGNKSETKKEQGTEGTKEKIVTSVPPLRWLTQKIAGDDFEVISIVQPNMNHELFEPKPSDLKILENSKVFFTYNMLGFEETISNSLSDKNKIVNNITNYYI